MVICGVDAIAVLGHAVRLGNVQTSVNGLNAMNDETGDLIDSLKTVSAQLLQVEIEILEGSITTDKQIAIAKLLIGLGELMREHALSIRDSQT